MRLKKIEILGFKSFLKKTVIEFEGGITAIVGPNGCGKSNIADAFRWVLGEQSAKSMRGNKMYDVIFAGASNYKPVNIAEVTLTFTDVAGMLPVDYEEVAVTRRLHRNGDSDYLINRHPVRLKDVQALFLDAGMGRDAFSIFEQGKVDEVIQLPPLERRAIFEDAAGIARFLLRKKEALRKLELTDQNISRLKDIHQEVEKQVVLLEQQSYKAQLYQDKRSQLEKFEKAHLVGKWTTSDKRWQEATAQMEKSELKLSEGQKGMSGWESELQKAKQLLEEQEALLNTSREELFKTRSAKELKAQEKQAHADRLLEIDERKKQIEQEKTELIQRRKELQDELKRSRLQHKDMERQLDDAGEVTRALREKVQQLDAEVGKLREQQQKVQQERLKQVQAEGQAESEQNQIRMRIEHSQERLQQLQDRQQILTQAIEGFQQALEEKKGNMQTVSQSVDEQRGGLQRLERQFKEISQEIQQMQTEIDGVQRELTEGNARQKVLMKLREEMQGFSQAAKKLIHESQQAKSPLHNKIQGLYELFSADVADPNLLAAAMRPYMHTLVVRTVRDFQDVLHFARENKLKDFSILCLEHLRSNFTSSGKSNSKELKALLEGGQPLTRHFLQQIFVATSTEKGLEAIRAADGFEVWTQDGAFIDKHHVVFYPVQGESHVFAREAEIKTLEKKIAEQEKVLNRLNTSMQETQKKKIDIQTKQNEADKSIRREEMKLVEVNFALQRAHSDLEKAQKERQQIEGETRHVAEQTQKYEKALEEVAQRYIQSKKKASDAQQQSMHTDVELDQRLGVLKGQQRDLREKEQSYQKLQEQFSKLTYALNLLDMRCQENQQQEERLVQELKEHHTLKENIGNQETQCEKALKTVEKTLKELETNCRKGEEEVQKKKGGVLKIEAQGKSLQEGIKKIETEHYQLGIQCAQHAVAKQTIETELQERYKLTIEEARQLDFILDKTLEQSDKQIKALRQELEEMGAVNMTAIEECAQYQERRTSLSQQIQDLAGAQQELIRIIADLDGESRKQFKEVFAQVRTNFQKNFSILFRGGEADLQLTEHEDVLEAGVEIIAKPPGKQMRSISLMSGGEKCLTAVALLFAIFEVRPAPFCILDEIDAPLDDSNIERFAQLLKQFTDKCQFMIITHNKRTMAIADVLFGVSMEEKGVSKLLALNFSRQPDPVLVGG